MILRKWFAYRPARDMDSDDPRLIAIRRDQIRAKPFLANIYRDWYAWIAASLPPVVGPVLELGAGAGFLGETIPGLVSTELVFYTGINAVLDGQRLPFMTGSLRAIVFTDVLHHLPQPREFFREAARCVRPGGRVVMVEPRVTRWSRLIYPNLHNEVFDPGATRWEFPPSGPLSGSNQALPWIIFERDRAIFEREFPQWQLLKIQPVMALRYLVSGGLTTKFSPFTWTYPFWRWLDERLTFAAMFAFVSLERREI